MSLQVICPVPPPGPIEQCITCEDFQAQFIANVLVDSQVIDGATTFTLESWLNVDTANRSTEFTFTGQVSPFFTQIGGNQSFQCDIVQERLADIGCAGGTDAFVISITDNAMDPPREAATPDCEFIIFPAEGISITVEPNPVILCNDPEAPPSDPLVFQGSKSYELLLDNGATTVTIESESRDRIELTFENVPQNCTDCGGNSVDCESGSVACQNFDRFFTVSNDCTTVTDEQRIRVARRVCFECPPDRCNLMTTGDPLLLLAEQGLADQELILPTVTNGCVPLSADNVNVSFQDTVLCSNCCRGEISIRREWAVRDLICDRFSGCVQHLRVRNPCWEKYFPSFAGCPCDGL